MTKEVVFNIGLILGIIIIVILTILWDDSFNNGTEEKMPIKIITMLFISIMIMCGVAYILKTM